MSYLEYVNGENIKKTSKKAKQKLALFLWKRVHRSELEILRKSKKESSIYKATSSSKFVKEPLTKDKNDKEKDQKKKGEEKKKEEAKSMPKKKTKRIKKKVKKENGEVVEESEEVTDEEDTKNKAPKLLKGNEIRII